MDTSMTEGSITLAFDLESDGTGRLKVSASAGGFAGRAEAWMDADEVAVFARSLDAFPLPDGGLVLAGGFGKSSADLDTELVALRVYRVGNLGQVGIRCHLAGGTSSWPPTRPKSVPEVHLELLTTYERLRTFGRNLTRIAEGSMEEAIIGQEALA
jgi:hypothetical protein